MAKNTGEGYRNGTVTGRTQTYNSKTEKYVKRNTETGQFVACKDTPFKNIRREDALLKKKEDNKDKK